MFKQISLLWWRFLVEYWRVARASRIYGFEIPDLLFYLILFAYIFSIK